MTGTKLGLSASCELYQLLVLSSSYSYSLLVPILLTYHSVFHKFIVLVIGIY